MKRLNMSVHLNLNELTDKVKNVIKKLCCLQPKQVGFSKRDKYSKPKDPIQFYIIDTFNNKCILPYAIGNGICKYNINQSRNYVESVYNFTGKLWDDQLEIAKNALNYMIKTGTVTLGLYPGFGKTILSAYLSSHQNGVVLVTYTRTPLQVQWKHTFDNFTDAKCWIVGEPMIPGFNVILSMDTRIHKIPAHILKMVKCLVIDEAHMFCTPGHVGGLLATEPLYIIACSATLNKRRDDMQAMIHLMCDKHGVFKSSTKPFTVYKLITGVTVELEKNKNGETKWSQLVHDLAFHPLRNDIIMDLVDKNANYKILILTLSKPHAFYLKEELEKKGKSVDVLAGTKKMYLDSNILVGTLSKIGTGFDEATFCRDFGGRKLDMLIFCGSTKDEGSLEQFTGRVFRADFPVIFDLVDNNHISKNHWRIRRDWYYERGGKIEVVEMKADEKTGSPIYVKSLNDNDDNINIGITPEKIVGITMAQNKYLHVQNINKKSDIPSINININTSNKSVESLITYKPPKTHLSSNLYENSLTFKNLIETVPQDMKIKKDEMYSNSTTYLNTINNLNNNNTNIDPLQNRNQAQLLRLYSKLGNTTKTPNF
jgi:hypothetical protein